MNTIGVDVDSKYLVCQIRRNGKDFPSAQFANDPAGHRKFIKWATKHGKPARVCMEATGVYSLPFALTLITNEHAESTQIVHRSKAALSAEVFTEALDASWPAGIISLSHVALPFPPDDPLYGRGPAPSDERIFLGQMEVRGERGLLRFPTDWLMRLRHNPFYEYQQAQVLEWLDASS